jgi:RNA polymerase sigma-70 factor (ECF subfamily)
MLINGGAKRFMGGRGFLDKEMLAAVKPFKSATLSAEDRISDSLRSSLTAEPNFKDGSLEVENRLETLFNQHYDRVFRAAYRVTGSAADAEDASQTVFLRLARAETFTAPDNPESYFARAAVNASLDLLRSRKRSKWVAIEDLENAGAPLELVSRNPEASHEDRELRSLIREAVAKLGPTAGQMFALRYFEGYDNGEIARMMKTSALVVGVTLHRARARLRKEIGTYLQKHQ